MDNLTPDEVIFSARRSAHDIYTQAPVPLLAYHGTQVLLRTGVGVMFLHGWGRARATPRRVTRRAERVWEWRSLAVAMLADPRSMPQRDAHPRIGVLPHLFLRQFHVLKTHHCINPADEHKDTCTQKNGVYGTKCDPEPCSVELIQESTS